VHEQDDEKDNDPLYDTTFRCFHGRRYDRAQHDGDAEFGDGDLSGHAFSEPGDYHEQKHIGDHSAKEYFHQEFRGRITEDDAV